VHRVGKRRGEQRRVCTVLSVAVWEV